MAKATIEVLVDDLTGERFFDEDQGRTVFLSLNDRSAQVDLTNEHIEELEKMLAPYFGTATIPAQARRRVVLPTQGGSGREGMQAIRRWAKRQGYKVSERGRIPYAIMDAYTKAHMLNK